MKGLALHPTLGGSGARMARKIKRTPHDFRYGATEWGDLDSNQGPTDYESRWRASAEPNRA